METPSEPLPGPDNVAPTRLLFEEADAWGRCRRGVEWDAATSRLTLLRGEHEAPVAGMEVTERRWRSLWRKLDALGAWDWPESFEPHEIMVLDGVNWTLEIEVGGRTLRTGGSNAWPPDAPGDHPSNDPTETFRKLRRAMAALSRP